MLMNLESIIKLFHTLVLSILIHGAENSLDSKSRPPRELNTFFVWSFFLGFKNIRHKRNNPPYKKRTENQFENGKNQQDKMSNIKSKKFL